MDSIFNKLIKVSADTTDINSKLVPDLVKAQAALNALGKYTKTATGITETMIPVMDKFGVVTNKVMSTITTSSGKPFTFITQGAQKSGMAMDDLTRAAQRAMIVAPVWMAIRTAMQWVLGTLNEGYNDIINFEKAFMNMTQTIKGYGGDLKTTLNDLRGKIEGLSQSVGVDETKIIQTFQKFNQAGLNVADSWRVTNEAIKGNITNFGTLENTVTTLTKAYILYKDSVGSSIPVDQQVSLIQAKILELRKNNIIESDGFNKSLANFLPIGKSVNFTLDEQLALLASLSNLEQSGGEAGTRMSASILLLSKNLRQVGSDFGMIVRPGDNPFETLITILDKLNKLSSTGGGNAEQQKWITDLFGGQRTSKGGRELLELTDKLRENLKNISTEGDNGANKVVELMDKYNKGFADVNDSAAQTQAKMKQIREDMGKAFIEGIVGEDNFPAALKKLEENMKGSLPIFKILGEEAGTLFAAAIMLKIAALNPVIGIAGLIELALIKGTSAIWEEQINKQKTDAANVSAKAIAELDALKVKYGTKEQGTSIISQKSANILDTTLGGKETIASLSGVIRDQLEKLQRAKDLIDMHVKGYSDLQIAQINLNRYISDEVGLYNKKTYSNGQQIEQLNEQEILNLAMVGNYEKIAQEMGLTGDQEKKILEMAKLTNVVIAEREKLSVTLIEKEKLDIETKLNIQKNLGNLTTLQLIEYNKQLVENSKYAYQGHEKNLELYKLELDYVKEISKLIGEYSNEFKNTFQTSLKDALQTGDVDTALGAIKTKFQDMWFGAISKQMTNMIPSDIFEGIGGMFAGLEDPVAKAHYDGIKAGVPYIVQAHIDGMQKAMALSTPGGNIGAGYGSMASTGYQFIQDKNGIIQAIPSGLNGVGIPADYASNPTYRAPTGYAQGFTGATGGLPSWVPFNQKLNTMSQGGQKNGSAYGQGTGTGMSAIGMIGGAVGAYGAYQSAGGGTAGTMAAVGGIMMMIPGLQIVGLALMVGSMFMGSKKTTSTQSSWQPQAINNMPLNVITGGAPLPEKYALPSSAFFSGKQGRQRGNTNITISIGNINGDGEDVANKIANKVADIYNRESSRGLVNTYPQ